MRVGARKLATGDTVMLNVQGYAAPNTARFAFMVLALDEHSEDRDSQAMLDGGECWYVRMARDADQGNTAISDLVRECTRAVETYEASHVLVAKNDTVSSVQSS